MRAGKVLPSTLLRKLGNYSRKNRLYQAFRELGCVVRTAYLLKYISSIEVREQATEETNKTETNHRFIKWAFFGGAGVIAENDPVEQDKRMKYKQLVGNIIMFQNVVDMTYILLIDMASGPCYDTPRISYNFIPIPPGSSEPAGLLSREVEGMAR